MLFAEEMEQPRCACPAGAHRPLRWAPSCQPDWPWPSILGSWPHPPPQGSRPHPTTSQGGEGTWGGQAAYISGAQMVTSYDPTASAPSHPCTSV